ncbi:MAG: PepSY domain-containing protein [Brevirhabdus sp.]
MRKIAIAAFSALTFSTAAFAASGAMTLTLDTVLGTSIEVIQTTLIDMGYEVRKSEMEDGQIEVYFVGNGQRGEVYVSPTTGKPTRIKIK